MYSYGSAEGVKYTWDDYITNVIHYDYLPHAWLQLWRNNHIVYKVLTILIAIAFALKRPQKENKNHLHALM